MLRSTLLTAMATALLAHVAQATYGLDTVYDASNFFQEFVHFSEPDPTQGFVEYVDQPTAQASGLSGIRNGTIYMGVDSTTFGTPKGRRSIRVESQKTFTKGLFIADIAHMPSNTCGVWPAFWTFGPNWPTSGEIDIIEGIHKQSTNSIFVHTSQNRCEMSDYVAEDSTPVVSKQCNAPTGCSQQTDNQNYGDGFNANGGGVYAMEWTDLRISVWFFPRCRIPKDITSGSPQPSSWGQPIGNFASGPSCDFASAFKDHKIVFDTTFCGNWAGATWHSTDECSPRAPTCEDYVSSYPRVFADAFWSINSVKVYQAQIL
ncbi:hypothetical protein V2A60_005109 [Cordyceps javanica]|uniref:endo-1,3(4)-beta-glucanase n=1 Tax=Cordyceps javanica TaxID=43265 RepID=A0A545W9J2_9HYPO|nr:endo-1,3(4)-beta-glucanase [Cordyceps javanica]TQW10667.1 endo-1,3(4)-beta-glucanase [Cordyceps javanica]